MAVQLYGEGKCEPGRLEEVEREVVSDKMAPNRVEKREALHVILLTIASSRRMSNFPFDSLEIR